MHVYSGRRRRFRGSVGKCQGFDRLGLRLDRKLDASRYAQATPANCRTFASTGGEGVHFSFLLQDGMVRENSPVIVTIPAMPPSYVVGENLFDFLCLGSLRGFFALEELAYNQELTLKAFTEPEWTSTDSRCKAMGFFLDGEAKLLLRFLTDELALRPWKNAARFAQLQEQYSRLLEPAIEAEF